MLAGDTVVEQGMEGESCLSIAIPLGGDAPIADGDEPRLELCSFQRLTKQQVEISNCTHP